MRRCAEIKKKGGVRRCAALCGGGPALCGAVRGKKKIQVRILVLWKTRIGEFSFSGKRDSKNSRFVENENSEICGKREFSFYAERESQNSRFVENQNWRISFFWRIRIREFSFCGKRDSENSRFMENKNPEICGKKTKEGSGAVRCCAGEKKKRGGIRRCAALCREGDRRCAALCRVKKRKKKKGVRRCAALCGVKKKKKRGSGVVRRCAEGDRRCAALCGKK